MAKLGSRESPVEVNIESSAFEGYDELNVFHVETDQTPDYIDRYYSFKEQVMNFLKGLISQKIHSDVVSFMAEHFSIYAVGAPYVATYQFYDANDELIQSATQILKHGDTVQLPPPLLGMASSRAGTLMVRSCWKKMPLLRFPRKKMRSTTSIPSLTASTMLPSTTPPGIP